MRNDYDSITEEARDRFDTDKPRRELQSAFQRALDNLFNRVRQLEIADKARKKAIDNLISRLDAMDEAIPLAKGFEDDGQAKQSQYPDPYEGITPIRECSIAQLIDCGPECAIYTDVEKTVEIERRIEESYTRGLRIALDNVPFSKSAGSEGEPQ